MMPTSRIRLHDPAPRARRRSVTACAAGASLLVSVPAVAQQHGDHTHGVPSASGQVPIPEMRDWQQEDDVLVAPSYAIEHTTLLPGQRNEIAIYLQVDPGWHIYWPGQNDTGFPLSAAWTVSNDDVTISDRWIWPKPTRYESPGNILDHVFVGHALVRIPVWVAPDAEGDVTITANLDWLVCKDVCLFENAEIEITLPITADVSERRQAATWSIFPRFEGMYPAPLVDAHGDDRFEVERDDERVVIRVPGAASVSFAPHQSGLILADTLGEAQVEGDTLSMSISEHQGDTEGHEPHALRGVLEAYNEFGGTMLLVELGAPAPERAPWLPDAGESETDDRTSDEDTGPASEEHGGEKTKDSGRSHDHGHESDGAPG